jgi:hypothetical protein
MLSADRTAPNPARRAKDQRLKVVDLDHAVELYGGDGIVAEVVTITPDIASAWLKANKCNRPVRRKHVDFLAGEITRGNWQVNGEAIIIAENEDIMDGQHRLLAIIEAGEPIRSLVVYGVKPEAFSTIDTGAVRSGADALFLHFSQLPVMTVKCAATAAQWCARLEKGNVLAQNRLSNTDIIAYVKKHTSLFQCAETLQAYPKDARPLSLGVGCALYEMFTRKNATLADSFLKALYTGENVTRADPEWLLRQAFLRDAQRTTKLPSTAKVKMVIKGWNWRRRGMPEASPNVIAIRADDDQRIRIL